MKIIEKIHQKRTTKKFIKSSLQSSTWQHYQAKKKFKIIVKNESTGKKHRVTYPHGKSPAFSSFF